MSRDLRDLLEETEVRVRALEAEIQEPTSEDADPQAVVPRLAAAQLHEGHLLSQLKALQKRKRAAFDSFDSQVGRAPEMIALMAFCIAATLSRGAWAIAEDAAPDERGITGIVFVLISVALYVSRWRRFRVG